MTVTAGLPAPAVPDQAWIEQRRRNVAGFMQSRALDFGELSAFMRERVGPGEILLTSSPVQGLANPSSDFDFIRIQAGPIEGARISTKIFDRGHHLEVVSFAEAEQAASVAELARLAALAPAAGVAGLRSWDKRLEPRRKQTERIVNGITADGRMPYLDALPLLGVMWARGSLHTALEHVVHLGLAEAAGERRGRLGYATNVLLHLMDALLSQQADVYTTRKWFLLRWHRAGLARTATDPAVAAAAAALDELRARIGTALGGADPGDLAPAFVELGLQVARVITGTAVAVQVALTQTAQRQAFLPGAEMVLDGDRAVLVTGAVEPLAGPLDQVPGTGAGPAAALLRTVRAGLAGVTIS